jgi:hypothetical protein
MQPGQAVTDAGLGQVVAAGHLAAKGVAPVGRGHLGGIIGKGVDQHRDVQVGPAEGVGDGRFLAEIGQGHEDPVDLIAMRSKQLCTAV